MSPGAKDMLVWVPKKISFLFLGAALFSACSARPSGGLNLGRVVNYTQCVLPSDQGRGSLEGSWSRIPVPVVFDNDFYLTDNGEIMPSMRAAITSWNTWAGLKGLSGFSITSDGSGLGAGREIPAVTDCAQATYTSQVTDVVGIWKISSSGNHDNVRAACKPTSTGAPGRILTTGVQGQTDWITLNGRITGASILLNFDEFNSPGNQHVDVESLLLHELGHVLGLLHSCNGSTAGSIDGTSAPNCRAGISSQYLDAAMFPFLEVNLIRRKLGQNDYNRINCLY
jgi:hypothetical protein